MKRLLFVIACLGFAGSVSAQPAPFSIPPATLYPPVIVFPASAVNGAGVVTSPQLLLPDGTVGAPGLAYALDTNTGIRRSGSDSMCFTTGGGDLFCGSANITISSGVNLLFASGKVTQYAGVTTAGWGVEAVNGQATTGTVTNTGTASIATYTNGAADGVYRVSCEVNITVSTNHTFSCDVTYTDRSNTARTLVLPMFSTAGAQLTTNLMTNAVGAGAFTSSVMQIGVKASTAIVVRTSSGGTFTTVTYTASGVITQVG